MSTEIGRRREILVYIANIHENAPSLSYIFPEDRQTGRCGGTSTTFRNWENRSKVMKYKK